MIHAPLPYIWTGTIADKISGFRIIWKRIPKPEWFQKLPIPGPSSGTCANRAIAESMCGFVPFVCASAKRGTNDSRRSSVHRADPARTLAAIAHAPETTGNRVPGPEGSLICGPGPRNRAWFSGPGHRPGGGCGRVRSVYVSTPYDPYMKISAFISG